MNMESEILEEFCFSSGLIPKARLKQVKKSKFKLVLTF